MLEDNQKELEKVTDMNGQLALTQLHTELKKYEMEIPKGLGMVILR